MIAGRRGAKGFGGKNPTVSKPLRLRPPRPKPRWSQTILPSLQPPLTQEKAVGLVHPNSPIWHKKKGSPPPSLYLFPPLSLSCFQIDPPASPAQQQKDEARGRAQRVRHQPIQQTTPLSSLSFSNPPFSLPHPVPKLSKQGPVGKPRASSSDLSLRVDFAPPPTQENNVATDRAPPPTPPTPPLILPNSPLLWFPAR